MSPGWSRARLAAARQRNAMLRKNEIDSELSLNPLLVWNLL